MKTIRRVLDAFVLVAILAASPAFAKAPWEVAVLFLGGDETEDYQRDVDRNLMELSRLKPGAGLRLSIFRALSDRGVQFFPDPQSPSLHPMKQLFFDLPYDIQVAGEMIVGGTDVPWEDFLGHAFKNPEAKRLLIVYGHGLGYEGMRVIPLKALRHRLERALPRRQGKALDLLWLDACFMATLEVAYELRGLTPFLLASEEAEFSAGAPFDTLQEALEDDVEAMGKALADRFLESYSTLEEGSQVDAVLKSSATISLVATEKLEPVVGGMKQWAQALKTTSGDWRAKLRRRLPKIQMEKTDLVDVGSLGRAARDFLDGKAVLPLIEADTAGKLRTNPRLLARAPKPGSLLIYGYERWTRGDRTDGEVLEKLPKNLTPDGFAPGPGRKEWPRRTVNLRLYLTPFTVGLHRFHFYFLDPQTLKPIGKATSHVRHSDYMAFPATRPENPLRFSGYTQGIGATAEKYSGLAVLSPVDGVPSVDYLDLDFYQATRWGDF